MTTRMMTTRMTKARNIPWLGLASFVVSVIGLAYTIKQDSRSTTQSSSGGKSGGESVDAGTPSGAPDYRARVVAIAKSQVGQPLRDEYLADAAPQFAGSHPSWCGIFALWTLHQAGLGVGVQWIVGKGFLFRLSQTADPQPGDLAYFDRAQHHAIVARVHDGQVELINGNGSGAVVSLSTAPRAKARAYYSIQKWINEARNAQA